MATGENTVVVNVVVLLYGKMLVKQEETGEIRITLGKAGEKIVETVEEVKIMIVIMRVVVIIMLSVIWKREGCEFLNGLAIII